MENKFKEYTAVPTEPIPTEPVPTEPVPKKAGWSIIILKAVLLVASLLAINQLYSIFSSEAAVNFYEQDAREPCMLKHDPSYKELKAFVQELKDSLGPKRHHRKHMKTFDRPGEPFCKLHKLEAESTIFQFSPETFQKAKFLLNGETNRGGHVRISKSTDSSLTDVKVNVTVYSGNPKLQTEIDISAYENEGDYVIQVERDRKDHHCHHEKPKQKNCLVYSVDIEFPSNVDYYESLEFHARKTERIQGGKGIEDIQFGSIKAGLGYGAIIFDTLKANTIKLAVLRGVVMGTYQPRDTFWAASVKGATKVNLEPTGEHINITATSTFGPATVDLPAESFTGDFSLFHFFGSSPTIQAPNPEDIHVTKLRHGVRAGYYKETNTGSKALVVAKFHGSPSLYLN